MSFFKRLTNVGKGLWKVNVGPRDPGERSRIAALEEELRAAQARVPAGAAKLPTPAPTGASAGPLAEQAALEARLDRLAEELRQGRLDRAAYDELCEAAIRQADEEEAARAPDGAPRKTL